MTKTTFAHGQLRSIVERIERLEEEKKVIASDIREVYAEAKASGFDVKILRKIIGLRKIEAAEREEQEAMLDIYMGALGMLPLFEAAEAETVTDRLRESPDNREAVKATATRYRMEDQAALSQNLADAGLISEDANRENQRLAQALNDKWGDGKKLWAAPEIAENLTDPGPSEAGGTEAGVEGAVPSAPADVPHDPVTGEVLTDAISEWIREQHPDVVIEREGDELVATIKINCVSSAPVAVSRGEEAGEVPPHPSASTLDAGPMPAFLNRRAQREAIP